MAGAVGRLSPEMMVALLSHTDDGTGDAAGVVDAVVTRMTPADDCRLHCAQRRFQGELARPRRAGLPHAGARPTISASGCSRSRTTRPLQSPFGSTEGFEDVWNHVAEKLITSYSDEPFVSDSYARELSGEPQPGHHDRSDQRRSARARSAAGSATVATSELRRLDLTLLLDLLRIEEDDARWGTLMPPVVALLEDLLLVGDFDALIALVSVLTNSVREASASAGRRQRAIVAIDLLAGGSMMRHLTTHLATIDDAQFERVKAMCTSLGEVLVRPIAEAISTDIGDRVRDRLTSMLIAFGPAGRRQVERLKSSQNPAVRRTALFLLRELGGHEALPELTELLSDRSPQIQREAFRAILSLGSDRAFEVLQRALTAGSVAVPRRRS